MPLQFGDRLESLLLKVEGKPGVSFKLQICLQCFIPGKVGKDIECLQCFKVLKGHAELNVGQGHRFHA